MTVKEIPITNKQDWLENRLLDVTSTEVSCLFNLNPFKSEFQLYNEKKDKLVVHSDSERMKWGRLLEKSIAEGCAEQQGWDIEPFNIYMTNPDTRMGSSFDFKITSGDEVGIMEVKNVDGYIYRTKWDDDGNGNITAPPVYELQLQAQLHVSNINWGCIVALVGGNEMKLIMRSRDKEVGQEIETKVKEFWDKVKSGTPPKINYEIDADYVMKNFCNTADPSLICNADEDIDKLVDKYHTVNRDYNAAKKLKDSVKAQILEKSGGASKIVSKYGTIHCGMTRPNKGTLITKEMVGTYVNSRNGFRQFKFYQPKGV